MRKIEEIWAAFWCALFGRLLYDEMSGRERTHELREIASREHRCPNGKTRRYSISTLRRKLRRFKTERLKGFCTRRRSDLGGSRVTDETVIHQLIELKRELPSRSADTLSRMLYTRTGVSLSRSTLYRYLKAAGATRLKLGVDKTKVRRRWTRDKVNELWVGDFEEGPYVLYEGETVPTHLSLFIDCRSRYIVAGRYYYRQNLAVLEDTLFRAFAIHGKPHEIYLDNGKVYHSRAYKLMCAELGIRPIYRKAGDPAPGGLVERFFRSAQDQFESEVRAGDILSLDDLNRAFGAFLDIVYHDRVHSELGMSPNTCYQDKCGIIRQVDLSCIHDFFLRREIRTVNRIYSDVSLDRRLYRVDKKLRGDRVEVRFDPFGDAQRVYIHSLDGERLGEGLLHQREEGEDACATRHGSRPKNNFVQDLCKEQERRLKEQAEGIDFRKVPSPERWAFSRFAICLARELNLKGELSAFDAGQLETLRKFWATHAELSAEVVRRGVRQAEPKNIRQSLFEIRSLIS